MRDYVSRYKSPLCLLRLNPGLYCGCEAIKRSRDEVQSESHGNVQCGEE